MLTNLDLAKLEALRKIAASRCLIARLVASLTPEERAEYDRRMAAMGKCPKIVSRGVEYVVDDAKYEPGSAGRWPTLTIRATKVDE